MTNKNINSYFYYLFSSKNYVSFIKNWHFILKNLISFIFLPGNQLIVRSIYYCSLKLGNCLNHRFQIIMELISHPTLIIELDQSHIIINCILIMRANESIAQYLIISEFLLFAVACPQYCVTCTESYLCINCDTNYYLRETSNTCLPDQISGGVSAGIILAIIFGGLTVLALMSICVWKNCCDIFHGRGFQREQSIIDNMNNSRQLRMESIGNLVDNDDQNDWKSMPLGEKFTYQDICTICLENRVNGELCCKHKFHDLCLAKWTTRAMSCPECRAKIKEWQIFCTLCYQKYRIINFQKGQIKSYISSLCPSCR